MEQMDKRSREREKYAFLIFGQVNMRVGGESGVRSEHGRKNR